MNPKTVYLAVAILLCLASCRSSQPTTYNKPIELPKVKQELQVEVVSGSNNN